jgi:hypothetical protein
MVETIMKILLVRPTLNAKIIMLIVLILIALPILYSGLPRGVDWPDNFRPAALAMLHGQSPYDRDDFHFYNAPWTLLPFIPFALLPYQLGRLCTFLAGLLAFCYVAYKMNAKYGSMILFLTSWPVIACLYEGGIDWLPMLSFVLPAPIGLLFAAMKPQIGFGIGLYWLADAWRVGGMPAVVRTFLPVGILLLVSLQLYGAWFARFSDLTRVGWNISLFPYEVPVGLYLLWAAMAQKRSRTAMASSTFLSPYISGFSLAVPLVALFEHPRLLFLAWACLWAYVLVHALL